MARRLRLHVPGGFYHVTLRGNHRQPIFFSDDDRELLDRLVARALEHRGARLHAYCWMTNHVHLLVQVAEAPLGRLMLQIASPYARKVQATLDTTGHFFERRHHAVLVDADDYLLTLVRYVHNNPVRAGLVADAAAYPWSSHLDYLGARRRSWVTTDHVLQRLSRRNRWATAKYRGLMSRADEDRWGYGTLVPHPRVPQILGSDDFVCRVLGECSGFSSRDSLDELLRRCCERFQVTEELLASPARARRLGPARAWLAHHARAARAASTCEVARRLGRSEGAIRQLMVRYP